MNSLIRLTRLDATKLWKHWYVSISNSGGGIKRVRNCPELRATRIVLSLVRKSTMRVTGKRANATNGLRMVNVPEVRIALISILRKRGALLPERAVENRLVKTRKETVKEQKGDPRAPPKAGVAPCKPMKCAHSTSKVRVRRGRIAT